LLRLGSPRLISLCDELDPDSRMKLVVFSNLQNMRFFQQKADGHAEELDL